MARDLSKAEDLYVLFQAREPRSIGVFDGLVIPVSGQRLGRATWIVYRSDKWNNGTHDYIHEFGPRVNLVSVEPRRPRTTRLPNHVTASESLAKLGTCLEFGFKTPEGPMVGRCQGRKPELYGTPSKRGLILVQDKKRALVVIYGGKMRIEDRGIVD